MFTANLFAWGRKQKTNSLLVATTSLTNGEQKENLFCAVCYGPLEHKNTEIHLQRDSSEKGAISLLFRCSTEPAFKERITLQLSKGESWHGLISASCLTPILVVHQNC